jgi:hypothetical protein
VGLNAKAGLKLVTGLSKRLDHVNFLRGQALFDQAADDGAGHVASADECNAFAHEWCSLYGRNSVEKTLSLIK